MWFLSQVYFSYPFKLYSKSIFEDWIVLKDVFDVNLFWIKQIKLTWQNYISEMKIK